MEIGILHLCTQQLSNDMLWPWHNQKQVTSSSANSRDSRTSLLVKIELYGSWIVIVGKCAKHET